MTKLQFFRHDPWSHLKLSPPPIASLTDLFGRLLHVWRFEIGAEADDITVFVVGDALLVGEVQHVQEVLGDVVVLLEEQHQTCMKD